MADTPEIPEATDAFEKRVAITIAVLAVALSVIGNRGDNAKTDAIIDTNRASDQWAYYQADSMKKHLSEMHISLLKELGGNQPSETREKTIAALTKDMADRDTSKSKSMQEAKAFEQGADVSSKINDSCDLACLLLQIGVVICSVSILTRWHLFWFIGLGLGAGGICIGIHAFLL